MCNEFQIKKCTIVPTSLHLSLLISERSVLLAASIVPLLQVHPHGSTDSLPFCTMGSGSLAAMAVFEAGYREDLKKDEAIALVTKAIRSGTSFRKCLLFLEEDNAS